MSANNEIYITKKFEVYERDVDSCGKSLIGKGKNIEDAIEIANQYEKECLEKGYPVEYGISFE